MIIALELDFPAPPSWVLNQLDHCVKHRNLELTDNNKISLSNGYSSRSVIKDSVSYTSRFQKRYILGKDVEDWISNSTEFAATLPTVTINEGVGPYHGPHVDAGREYALTYMIETGGENILTSWWIKVNMPLVIKDNDDSARLTSNYDDQLCLLHQIKMEPNKWYLYNTRILHSVEGCKNARISLQMNVRNPIALLRYAIPPL
jgi:hypothetical protein